LNRAQHIWAFAVKLVLYIDEVLLDNLGLGL